MDQSVTFVEKPVIPKLPGYNMGAPGYTPFRADYKRSSRFEMKDGQCIYTPREEAEQARLQGSRPATSSLHPLNASVAEYQASRTPRDQSQSGFTPRFVALDKKVLRYFGFFEEYIDPAVIGSAPLDSNARMNVHVRDCTVLFYLEDGSIQVGERRQDNSGIVQGQLIKRMRVPKPMPGADGEGTQLNLDSSADFTQAADIEYHEPSDFEIGAELNLFGRLITIVDCDLNTKSYHASVLDRPVDEEKIKQMKRARPKDRYISHVATERKKQMEHSHRHTAFAASGVIKDVNRGGYMKFLQWDTKVLRFYCVWDDRQSMYGDQRKFVLRFYLADDTLDLVEEKIPNSGRRQGDFLKRGRAPKKTPERDVGSGDAFVAEYITPADLMVGETVTIFNRIYFIYACDAFTRSYYEQNFGITDIPEFDVAPEALPNTVVKAPVPAYSGMGTQEDSFGSVLFLVPKPPARDLTKLLQNEKKRLRFRAQFGEPKDAADAQRRFIMTYFTSDDTISVYEETIQNSGRWAGKFFERAKIQKPGSEVLYYDIASGEQDLIVGGVVEFHSHKFLISEVDEYSRKHLLKMYPDRPDLINARVGESMGDSTDFK